MHILPEGQFLKHQQYGLGIVMESDNERTMIDFETAGKKLFVTSIMSAELIGEAPAGPSRLKRRRKSTAKKAAAGRS